MLEFAVRIKILRLCELVDSGRELADDTESTNGQNKVNFICCKIYYNQSGSKQVFFNYNNNDKLTIT